MKGYTCIYKNIHRYTDPATKYARIWYILKTREKAKWNFEKAHSILQKVREIVLWGNSDKWTASCMTMLWQVNWQPLAVWSGSLSCSEEQCMPNVTLSICQRDVFMASIPRYEYIHSYWTYIPVYTSIYTNIHGFKHRTLWLLLRRTLTALRTIVMLFPWKTVGMHVRSSSSSAICVLNMEDSPGTVYTKLVQVYTSIF